MEIFQVIKLGPKPKIPDGTPDKRRGVKPQISLDGLILKSHIHKSKD